MNEKGRMFRDQYSIASFANSENERRENERLSVQNFKKERYTLKTKSSKGRAMSSKGRAMSSKGRAMSSKALRKIAEVAAVATIAVGGYMVYQEHQRQNSPAPIEETLKASEDLKLENSTIEQIEAMKESVANIDELSDAEIQNLLVETRDLYLTTVKDKLADVYNVETDKIQILPENDMADPESVDFATRQLASVLVNGEVVAEGDQIPQDLKDYFKECEYASTNVRNYVSKAEENYNRENAINALKDDMSKIEEMGVTEISKNDDGSLETYVIKVKDIENKKGQETDKQVAEQEDMDRE